MESKCPALSDLQGATCLALFPRKQASNLIIRFLTLVTQEVRGDGSVNTITSGNNVRDSSREGISKEAHDHGVSFARDAQGEEGGQRAT